MTTLHNEIVVDAPPAAVWSVLSTLDVLHEYDPGVLRAKRVVEWDPDSRIAFELFDCTLPVRRLRHTYGLTAEGGSTRVTQRMEYELKYGLLGALLDRAVVRRQWDAGIKGFFTGLKRRVESAR